MAEANYEKPASQVDLEARQADDYVPPAQLSKGVDPQPSDTGFVGVDPVYQNYANDTEAPYRAEKGPEAAVEEKVYSEDADFQFGKTEDGARDGDDEEEEEQPTGSGATITPSSPPGTYGGSTSSGNS